MNSTMLPQDILQQILDQLCDSPETIRSCSLVSRTWLPECRRHIHRRLILDAPTTAEETEALQKSCKFLEEAPHLAAYIRECSIRGSREGSIMDSGTMRHVFEMLTSLRSIELERLDWVKHPKELQSIPILFTAPLITSITLRYCRFNTYADFLPLVGSSPQLRKLEISHCDMNEPSSISLLDDQEPPQRKIFIQYLRLGGAEMSFIIDWLLHPSAAVSIDRLPVLFMSTPVSSGFEITSQLLQATGPSLEHLNFDFNGSIAHDYDVLQFVHNPNLRTLHLRGGSGRSAMFAGNTAVWSQALLNSISPDNSLEEITVCMRMDFIPLRGTHTNRWVEIESLLLQPHFRCLKKVLIHIITSMNIEANPIIGFVAGEMEQMMLTLSEKGVLRVVMESDYGVKEPDPVIIDWA